MAALSSAESPPAVFNGEPMAHDAEREPGPGLEALSAGFSSVCTACSASAEAEHRHDIPEEVRQLLRRGRSAWMEETFRKHRL